MPHSPDSPKCTCQSCRECLLATSAALYGLRDALVELSLALKDWQFEMDSAQRARAETVARDVLRRAGIT
jgi:hypothetical protein